jgi:hypothetical protein
MPSPAKPVGIKFGIIPLSVALLLPAIKPAHAVPAFAAQTGMACVQCHIGAFGPQLTPFGRAFKIGGYTLTGGDGWVSHVPVAIMIQPTFTTLGASFPAGSVPQHYAPNNNFSLDQVSLFVAGNLGEHSGALAQLMTYSGVDNTLGMDNIDFVPYTTVLDVGDKDLRIGFTLNNNPTVQDPYNSTPAWGFPYIASGIAPVPAAQTMLQAGFNHNVLGYTAYAWYDNSLYLEAGAYNTISPWTLARLGTSYGIGSTNSPAPYVRAAYEWNTDNTSSWLGFAFMHANVDPLNTPFDNALVTTSAFGSNIYNDYGFDGGFQYLGTGDHIMTVQGMYTHEVQYLGASAALVGGGLGANYALNDFQVNASYWYKNTYGVTLGWHKIWGPADPVLYAAGPLSGNANASPNSNAFIVEADWVPFGKDDSVWRPLMNLKLGAQYTIYTEFNGAGGNYDGFGRTAANNNTLVLYAWMIF